MTWPCLLFLVVQCPDRAGIDTESALGTDRLGQGNIPNGGHHPLYPSIGKAYGANPGLFTVSPDTLATEHAAAAIERKLGGAYIDLKLPDDGLETIVLQLNFTFLRYGLQDAVAVSRTGPALQIVVRKNQLEGGFNKAINSFTPRINDHALFNRSRAGSHRASGAFNFDKAKPT